MSRGDDEPKAVKAYNVGYGKPPAKTRFQKGRSGNPQGRPRKTDKVPTTSQLEFGKQPANQMLLAEAYRTVTVREGDNIIQLPAIQAVFRAMGVSAMKGNRFAQRTMAELVQTIEEEDRKLRCEYVQTAIEYKIGAMNELEYAKKHGLEPPELLPHPDDVIIDLNTSEVQFAGPRTPEEKRAWDRLLERRNEAQSEVNYYAERHRRARNPKRKQLFLEDWHHEQKMFDIINDRMPERYQTKLENRSWKEGASRAGDFALEDGLKRRT